MMGIFITLASVFGGALLCLELKLATDENVSWLENEKERQRDRDERSGR